MNVARYASTALVAAALLGGTLTQAASTAPPAERGAGVFDGRDIAFEVIDGWAVVEGDIIVGRAADLSRPRSPDGGVAARMFTMGYEANLWPRGASGVFEVPFTVSADPNGRVPGVVSTFNSTFAGLIQFVPRTTQADYVDFTLNLPDSAPACTSFIGRVGGRQVLNGPPACSAGTLLHEMGHAVGLLHEQSRPDRDQYVVFQPDNVAKNARSQSSLASFNRKAVGPYDFASIMHYGDFDFSANGRPAYMTLPPGIEIGQRRGYSAADVDTVRRLYGAPPSSVTITSAPPGLAVIVDGQTVTTPATFAWPPGSTHAIDVPTSPQTLSSVPYVFGRWNVDVAGDQRAARTIVVDAGSGAAGTPASAPAVTVYTANFVRLYPFTLTVAGDTAAARAATTASVSPQPQPVAGLAGSFFRARQLVTLTAATGPGIMFGGWVGTNYARVIMGQSNPSVTAFPNDSGLGTAGMDIQAYASQAPTLRVRGSGDDGTSDGFLMTVDGATSLLSPTSTALTLIGGAGSHQVLAVSPQYRGGSTTRYTFRDWDGAPGNPVTVSKPAAGQPSRDVTANFATQHLVTTAQAASCTGAVSIAGPSPDGFYDHGRVLSLAVAPNPGWTFVGWSDDLTGTASAPSITVNGEVFVTASYNLTSVPFALTGLSRRFAAAGDGGFGLVVYGTGFVPATQVFVAGFSRATTYLDGNRVKVTLTAADLLNAGELRVSVGNTDEGGCRILQALGLPVQAKGYAWPPTVDVVEFYNATLDHYFVTANADEMAKLDDGTFKGWARTGLRFKEFPADSRALQEGLARTVCRYYGNPAAGLDSHFYSAFKEECDDVKRKFPTSWVFESANVFQAVAPDRSTGACPDGTVAVYRLFNGRTDANHRYTTDETVRTQMMARGYVPEGYGPKGVALCAPA